MKTCEGELAWVVYLGGRPHEAATVKDPKGPPRRDAAGKLLPPFMDTYDMNWCERAEVLCYHDSGGSRLTLPDYNYPAYPSGRRRPRPLTSIWINARLFPRVTAKQLRQRGLVRFAQLPRDQSPFEDAIEARALWCEGCSCFVPEPEYGEVACPHIVWCDECAWWDGPTETGAQQRRWLTWTPRVNGQLVVVRACHRGAAEAHAARVRHPCLVRPAVALLPG